MGVAPDDGAADQVGFRRHKAPEAHSRLSAGLIRDAGHGPGSDLTPGAADPRPTPATPSEPTQPAQHPALDYGVHVDVRIASPPSPSSTATSVYLAAVVDHDVALDVRTAGSNKSHSCPATAVPTGHNCGSRDVRCLEARSTPLRWSHDHPATSRGEHDWGAHEHPCVHPA